LAAAEVSTHRNLFRVFAKKTSEVVGSPTAFSVMVCLILIWLLSGFLFKFSDSWQLIINTCTNIFTLLIVFLIQNTQNRDARAMHLKLDELLRAVTDARTTMVRLEDLSDEELGRLQKQFERIRQREIRKLNELPSGGAPAPPAGPPDTTRSAAG
jgi:low affinity Fe/Cu permease